MLKILMALYCHLPPRSPHHHHQKRQIKGEKKIEIDFQNEIPQILEHWEKIKFESKQASKHTANTGGDSEIRASVKQFQHWLLRQKLYLGKIFCCYFVLFCFKKQRQERET